MDEAPSRFVTTGPYGSMVNPELPVAFYRSVVPVIYYEPSTKISGCVGTAFCIASLRNGRAVFATAGHVVDEVINSPETRLPYILFPNANSIGVQMTDVVPVKIRSITPVRPNSDVALFAIDTNPTIDEMLGPPIPFAIETGKPVIGSRASAVGFERQEVVNIRHFVQLLRVSVGPIEDLHVQARDSVTVNFPCFQVGAVFEGGMSGGPVCDQEGNVIGIVSVGLDTSDASPYGYAASIVCLAELSIDLPNPDGTFSNFSFKQLSQLALIMHSKDFSINYRRTSEGLRILWSNDD